MNFDFAVLGLQNFVPETILTATFIVALLVDALFKEKRVAAGTAFVGMAIAGYFVLQQHAAAQAWVFTGTSVFRHPYGMFAVDRLSTFFKLILTLAGLVVLLFSFASREVHDEGREHVGEYYSLIVAALLGMFLMTGVTDILMMYIAIELVSISSYILAGFTKNVYRSSEAALKYVIFGAAASGMMLYGFSLLFGLTGTTNLFEINEFIGSHNVNNVVLLLSGVLILVGFGYKISAVPFHFWTPDVYEGAPITVTAFLSVASKVAGFSMLLRFLLLAYPNVSKDGFEWTAILTVMSVLTMTLGNLVAIHQTNMKRLLAYSSIAQAGYILMGVVILSVQGLTAVMIYFVVYLFMNLGAFYIVQVVAERVGSEEIEDYKGLAKRMPFMAGAMVLFMMSLTGIPMTAGFVGKLFLFAAVLDRAATQTGFYWLLLIAVLNSVVSLFYYIKVVKAMYLEKGEEDAPPIRVGAVPIILTLLMAVPTLYFGLNWQPVVDLAQKAVQAWVMQ